MRSLRSAAQRPGNGNMSRCPSRDDIDRVYRKAIELGATDEGAPGERLPGGAYIRDQIAAKSAFMK